MGQAGVAAPVRPAGRRKRPPTTPDPIEIAMEAEAAGEAPGGVAVRLLEKQERLIGWQIASERAGFALKMLTGAAGLALVAAIAWACWDASRASGAVIAPFDSAPALEAQGLTGEAIAREVVSRVTAMQNSAGADGEINVVIPQTGVSITEAQRLLRGWLGHETHVSGALRPSADGKLELSLWVDGKRVEVPAPPPERRGDADAWLDSAAAAAMRETDPYRFAVWSLNAGRTDDAEAYFRRIATAGPAPERAWGWQGLILIARNRGDLPAAERANEAALRLNPRFDAAPTNLAAVQRSLGLDEAARASAAGALRLVDAKDWRRRAQRAVVVALWDHDAGAAIANVDRLISTSPFGQPRYPPSHLAFYATGLAQLHETSRADVFIGGQDPLSGIYIFRANLDALVAAERWQDLQALLARPWTDHALLQIDAASYDRTLRRPWQAYLAARAGRIAEAEQLIATTPLDCYLCVRMRGRIAALAGRLAEADHWFAEAVRMGPSLADAEQEWGEAKLARGDAAGALALAAKAAAKAPRWADPKKLEGDARLRSGQEAAAAVAYGAAAKLAPRWAGLHLAWGEAQAALGKADEARAKWRAAAGMDQTPAERARVQALLASR